ncbi:MAG: DUF805 domain-containing protein [Hyphomonadaceae bacterium]|nr:DUF805 domain-containing protein [Hyphomonadaceae bacterium]
MSWLNANLRGAGRLNRLGLLRAQIASVFVTAIAAIIASMAMWALNAHDVAVWIPAFGLMAGQLYMIAPTVRRLHDLDLSGYWLIPIWSLSPIALAIWLLWPASATALLITRCMAVSTSAATIGLFIAPGQQGGNRFGAPPTRTST